jgi:hypothetical protein
MNTNYTGLNKRVNTAITAHLLTVKALPPNADVPVLAGEITEVVFGALNAGGLSPEIIETLGKGTLAAAKTQGQGT